MAFLLALLLTFVDIGNPQRTAPTFHHSPIHAPIIVTRGR